MARGRHSVHTVLADARRDPFAAALGSGRGLTPAQQAAQQATLAQRDEVSKAPKAVVSTDFGVGVGATVTSYYLNNDPESGLHREGGPARVTEAPDGARSEEYWYFGQRHREDGPALLITDATGLITEEAWYHANRDSQGRPSGDGVLHRNGGPARNRHLPDGRAKTEWYRWGRLDRADGPAVIVAGSDGQGSLTAYYQRNLLHREDGPAFTEYNSEVVLIKQRYSRRGVLHREDGPAFIDADASGKIVKEVWQINGTLHRERGPAIIDVDQEGHSVRYYYRHGILLPPTRVGRLLTAAHNKLFPLA